jgi:hypothetical protein
MHLDAVLIKPSLGFDGLNARSFPAASSSFRWSRSGIFTTAESAKYNNATKASNNAR